MKRMLSALLCASCLSGCALWNAEPWPKPGRGGFAEWMPIANDRANTLSQRLNLLRDRDAPIYATSDFVEAEKMLTRIRREVVGELNVDADKDMDALDRSKLLSKKSVSCFGNLLRRRQALSITAINQSSDGLGPSAFSVASRIDEIALSRSILFATKRAFWNHPGVLPAAATSKGSIPSVNITSRSSLLRATLECS
jgi:hypothetical protein